MNGIDLINGSGQTIPTACSLTEPVCRSQMLTVWRRLHIEVDSMREADGNFVIGTTVYNTRIKPYLTVPIVVDSTLEAGRFENGRVVINGNSFRVTGNDTDSILVQNNSGSTFSFGAATQFQLYDDDDFNDDDGLFGGDGTLDGDTGEDIPEPDRALLTAESDDPNSNIFAAAYIHPVYDVVDSIDNTYFLANITGDDGPSLRDLFTARDLKNASMDEYWNVYLLGAYQHTLSEDNDPTDEPCISDPDIPHCVTYGISTPFDGGDAGTLIYAEVNRPNESPGYSPDPNNLYSMAVTVAHEIAHLLNNDHGQGGIMGIDDSGDPVSNQLSPTMINGTRNLMHP